MIRCSKCDAEFTEAETAGATGCPKCGTTSLPYDTDNDVTIKINTSALRILGIWAENYAVSVDNRHLDEAHREPLKDAVTKILAGLHKQLVALGKDVPLSMSDEMGEIRKAGHDATLYRDGKEEV